MTLSNISNRTDPLNAPKEVVVTTADFLKIKKIGIDLFKYWGYKTHDRDSSKRIESLSHRVHFFDDVKLCYKKLKEQGVEAFGPNFETECEKFEELLRSYPSHLRDIKVLSGWFFGHQEAFKELKTKQGFAELSDKFFDALFWLDTLERSHKAKAAAEKIFPLVKRGVKELYKSYPNALKRRKIEQILYKAFPIYQIFSKNRDWSPLQNFNPEESLWKKTIYELNLLGGDFGEPKLGHELEALFFEVLTSPDYFPAQKDVYKKTELVS